MTNRKSALTEKVFILGVDGLDPRFSKKMLREGKMPNLQKFIDRGSCREDLVLLGGHPTVTPPMWTTLACGCGSNVHGIIAFNRIGSEIDKMMFNFDSRNCEAEPIWNVLVENGIKTAVFHWPGNAWPPTSDSENLIVCDGSTPGGLGMGAASLSQEFCVVADEKIEAVTFAPSATADLDKACVIKAEDIPTVGGQDLAGALRDMNGFEYSNIIMGEEDGAAAVNGDDRFSLGLSPVKAPYGWEYEIPADAKEFTLVLCKGLIRRPALILKNENGIYDRVALYKNKKAAEPFVVLEKGVMTGQIYDQAVTGDGVYKDANYNMKVLDMKEDGSHVEIFISNGMDMHADFIFQPSSLFYELAENVGYIAPSSVVGNHDPKIVTECMLECWDLMTQWQVDAIHYLIEKKGVQAIFSHMHNIDMQAHRFIRFMVDTAGYDQGPVDQYRKFMEDIYVQTDKYLGQFLHLLDEGWSIIITSDHAQVCPANRPPMIGDTAGVNLRIMQELGYTYVKVDENGNELREVDWERTKAVANLECNIWLNIKGRNKHTLPDGTVIDGIVDPADQYELEEQIMTDLYGYKHPVTGKRVVALALRNKDAVHFGYGGPHCGDICYWVAEGYNIDHADGLSTAYGENETSLSPIFVAAGPGFKKGFTTDRIIRQIDVAPTVATLLNVRMPAQCEGAPVYQIFDTEF